MIKRPYFWMIKNFVTKEKLFFGVFPQVKKINNPLLDLLGFIHFWIICRLNSFHSFLTHHHFNFENNYYYPTNAYVCNVLPTKTVCAITFFVHVWLSEKYFFMVPSSQSQTFMFVRHLSLTAFINHTYIYCTMY